MTSTNQESLLTEPIVLRRGLDAAADAELRRAVRRGQRTAVLPGVYVRRRDHRLGK